MKNLFRSMTAVAIGLLLAAASGSIGVTLAEEKEKAQEKVPLEDLRTFAEVFGRIKGEYVEPVDDEKLLKSAIRGMLSGLDPHSTYLDRETYRDLQVGTSGEFGGLGIEVGMENGFVKVIAPIDDTPAQRAGIKTGDLIIRIDDKPVKGMSLNDAVNTMRGKPGTRIILTILREGMSRPFNLDLERGIIQVASVKSRTLEPGYGYVRISHFQSRTTEDLLSVLNALEKENAGRLKGLVLDLRNNPGGVLNSAVGVSDAFLGGGIIVYTKGRGEDSELQFKAGPDDVLKGAPIVVLVNGGSASASEIVAGALRDHKRAIIMGYPTFGKGSVQTIVPIDDATALKLTTARYYTPSGHSIQAHGVEPDIELVRGELSVAEKLGVAPLKEVDLRRHLDEEEPTGKDKDPAGETGKKNEGAPGKTEKKDEGTADEAGKRGTVTTEKRALAAEDYALGEALNVLKGLNILGRHAQD